MVVARESIGLERAQRMVRGTFMASQGRQYAQITFIDAVARMWRADGLSVDIEMMASVAARQMMERRNLPPGHVRLSTEIVRQQFNFWWQYFLWICDYVNAGSGSRLPSHDDIDAYIVAMGGEDYMSSYLEEEVSAIKVMTDRYRNLDPTASMDLDEAIRRFALPALVRADRHWIAEPSRSRPGTIIADGGSMLRTLLAKAIDHRDRGWQVTDLERIYVRMAEILLDMWHDDPRFPALPTYRKLIDEFNRRNPANPVVALHPVSWETSSTDTAARQEPRRSIPDAI